MAAPRRFGHGHKRKKPNTLRRPQVEWDQLSGWIADKKAAAERGQQHRAASIAARQAQDPDLAEHHWEQADAAFAEFQRLDALIVKFRWERRA